MSSRLGLTAALAVVVVTVLAGCSPSSPSSAAPTTTVPPDVEALSGPQAGAAGEMLCQTTGFGGGAYYLLVTSMTERTTPACDEGTQFNGGQDFLDAMPGPPARRCELDVDKYPRSSLSTRMSASRTVGPPVNAARSPERGRKQTRRTGVRAAVALWQVPCAGDHEARGGRRRSSQRRCSGPAPR